MKHTLVLLSTLALLGCRKIESGYLDPGVSTFVSTSDLLSGAQYNMTNDYDQFQGYAFAQYWTPTYDDTRYDFSRSYGYDDLTGFVSEHTYKPLANLREIILLCSNEPFRYSQYGEPDNQIAIAKMLSVWRFQQMTDAWGDLPYSQSLGVDFTPAYDTQESIYLDLLRELDDALSHIKLNALYPIKGDLIYQGDMVKWQKFGNALKMRVAIRMADHDWPTAKNALEQVFAAGSMADNSDNAGFRIASPLFYNFDPQWYYPTYPYLASKTLVDVLLALDDPRTAQLVQPADSTGLFTGHPFGVKLPEGASSGFYSLPGTFFAGPETTLPLLEFPETCFILAEALERGAALPGTPAEWYEQGIRASMDRWGVSAADADTYLARTDVSYATAPGNWKQKIGLQKWLALCPQGTEAWAEWRRLDFGILQPPPAVGFIPTRLPYPLNEQNLNAENYQQAIGRMPGGDLMTNKVWWDQY